jgi:hypothetical protein
MGKLDDFVRIEAEIDFYDAVTVDLGSFACELEEAREKGVDIHDLRLPLAKKAAAFLERLSEQPKCLYAELEELTLSILYENHDLMIGDRISYDHPGRNDKGEFILDDVQLNRPWGSHDDFYFSIQGRRYRKDGAIGKIIIYDSLPLYAVSKREPRKSQKSSNVGESDE